MSCQITQVDRDVLGGRGLTTGYVFFYVRKDTETKSKSKSKGWVWYNGDDDDDGDGDGRGDGDVLM